MQMICEEHEILDKNIQNLNLGLKRWMESTDFQLWKIEFIWQMREFKRDLYRHFELEDDSAFFDFYPVRESKKGVFGLHIRREHAKLIITFEKIFSRLKKIKNAADPKLSKLETDLKQFISDIQEHESKERKVLSELSNRSESGA